MNEERHWYQVPHKFKTKEWTCPKKELITALTAFYREFNLENWHLSDIDHFLSCYFHLIKGAITPHHIRCVLTLIRKEEVPK